MLDLKSLETSDVIGQRRLRCRRRPSLQGCQWHLCGRSPLVVHAPMTRYQLPAAPPSLSDCLLAEWDGIALASVRPCSLGLIRQRQPRGRCRLNPGRGVFSAVLCAWAVARCPLVPTLNYRGLTQVPTRFGQPLALVPSSWLYWQVSCRHILEAGYIRHPTGRRAC